MVLLILDDSPGHSARSLRTSFGAVLYMTIITARWFGKGQMITIYRLIRLV